MRFEVEVDDGASRVRAHSAGSEGVESHYFEVGGFEPDGFEFAQ